MPHLTIVQSTSAKEVRLTAASLTLQHHQAGILLLSITSGTKLVFSAKILTTNLPPQEEPRGVSRFCINYLKAILSESKSVAKH